MKETPLARGTCFELTRQLTELDERIVWQHELLPCDQSLSSITSIQWWQLWSREQPFLVMTFSDRCPCERTCSELAARQFLAEWHFQLSLHLRDHDRKSGQREILQSVRSLPIISQHITLPFPTPGDALPLSRPEENVRGPEDKPASSAPSTPSPSSAPLPSSAPSPSSPPSSSRANTDRKVPSAALCDAEPKVAESDEVEEVDEAFASDRTIPDSMKPLWRCSQCNVKNWCSAKACLACGNWRRSFEVCDYEIEFDPPVGEGWDCPCCEITNVATSKRCAACETERSSGKHSTPEKDVFEEPSDPVSNPPPSLFSFGRQNWSVENPPPSPFSFGRQNWSVAQ